MRWVCLGGAGKGGRGGRGGGGAGAVFLHFSPFTSRESLRSHFLAVIRRFRNSCQLQIKTGWSGCNVEQLNTAES